MRPVKKSNATVEALGRAPGGFSKSRSPQTISSRKVYAAVDAPGNPPKLILRPGQRADIIEAEALAEPYLFEALITDKGFDSRDSPDRTAAEDAEVVIPSR